MHKGGANKLVLDSLLHVRNETRLPLVRRIVAMRSLVWSSH